MAITEVPAKFKPVINNAKNLLLSQYKDTRGIFLIGSIADSTYNKSSDIDLVLIKSHLTDVNYFSLIASRENLTIEIRLPQQKSYKKLFKIEEKLNFNKNLKIQVSKIIGKSP